MTWIVMAGGEDVPILHPQNTITLGSIAHGLAQINRFAGATVRPYSVAEHSLLCADIAAEQGHSPAVQLCCLLHDAHESVIGDVSTPVKIELGIVWRTLEARTQWRVLSYLGAAEAMRRYRTIVRAIDLVALATERRDLTAYKPERNRLWPSLEKVRPIEIDLNRAWRAQSHRSEWRSKFIARFEALEAQLPEWERYPTGAATCEDAP